MIKSIRLKNILSYHDEQIIDFELTKNSNIDNVVHYNTKEIVGSKQDIKISNIALVYGKNNSGKTNLINIIRDIRYFIIKGKNRLESFISNHDDSLFEIEFISDTSLYRYGVVFNGGNVIDEWLYFYKEMSNRKTMYFDKGKNSFNSNIGKHFEKQIVSSSSLYLTTLLNIVNDDLFGAKYINEIKKFVNNIDYIKPSIDSLEKSISFEKLELFENDLEIQETINTYISGFDTGINKVKISKLGEDVLASVEKIQDKFFDIMQQSAKFGDQTEFTKFVSGEINKPDIYQEFENIQQVRIKSGDRLYSVIGEYKYLNEIYAMDYEKFSYGTKKILVYLLTILLSDKKVFIIDEFERGLHPHAMNALLEFILENIDGKNIQFIITSHALELLDYSKISNEAKILLECINGSEVNYVSEYNLRFGEKVSSKILGGALPGSPIIKV